MSSKNFRRLLTALALVLMLLPMAARAEGPGLDPDETGGDVGGSLDPDGVTSGDGGGSLDPNG